MQNPIEITLRESVELLPASYRLYFRLPVAGFDPARGRLFSNTGDGSLYLQWHQEGNRVSLERAEFMGGSE